MNTIKTFGYKWQGYKNLWKTLPIALFVSVACVQPSLAEEKIMLRTLTVTGQGTETIPTTLSKVSLGVQVQGKTANVVQEEAARKSNAVVTLLKSQNVEKLETTGIQLNPIYSYKDNVRQTQGYEATNTVSFRVPTERTGKLLDEAVKAGATQINSVQFVATEEATTQARQQALKEATQDAQKQAGAVLSSLGFTSKEIVNIQIDNASTPEPILYRSAVPAAAMAEAAPTPIVAGEQEVGASVTLRISY
ncbi:SIMPL domain-containing protein [Rivularia sp. UHCC 0363]|uniref:SIMPL domain-containing protein n=1 Tax=Rivularia sp. UHCC 0363 TaxID=3110244 RepID=UPI002B21335C|nr:SIMPL domain-containing protein [Rivularia sp. UHCC 0363]MEA5599449.1 SIMPL domain-containing protein [Rivularia sp. UHCC 0363]